MKILFTLTLFFGALSTSISLALLLPSLNGYGSVISIMIWGCLVTWIAHQYDQKEISC